MHSKTKGSSNHREVCFTRFSVPSPGINQSTFETEILSESCFIPFADHVNFTDVSNSFGWKGLCLIISISIA